MKRADIQDYLRENYPHYMDEILLADGFEDAFVGVVETFGEEPKACYDWMQCLDVLMVRDNMTHEEAVEYMDFNVTGAYVGKHTPAFVHTTNAYDSMTVKWEQS